MAALDCARSFAKLRNEYDAKNLMPDVTSELGAIWPTPSQPVFKAARLA